VPDGTTTDTSQRYRIRPRRTNPNPRRDSVGDTGEAGTVPSNKVPAKVAVPVPVPVPVPVGGDGASQGRYRVRPSGFQFPQGPSAQKGFQLNPGAMPQFSGVQPEQPAPAAPSAPAPPQPITAPTDETPELTRMRAAEARVAEEQAAVPKKEKWWKSGLKMLAYGAQDMPPARDWGEFAYGAGRAAGSGIAGVAKHDLPGQIKKRYRVAEAQQNLEQAQKTGQVASQIQSRIDATKVRNARLNRDLTKDEVAAEQRTRKSVAEDLRRLPYIDPDNPTHAKILERAKEAGIDIDPESFGKGKNRPRIRVLDDDGVTEHWFEKDPAKGWVPVRIEGQDAISRLTDKRNPLTGETYSSSERRELAKQKFDFQKTEATIHDRQRDIALGYQKQGLDMRTASAQAEADAIDEMLPDLESDLQKQSGTDGDEIIAQQIQRMITSLKDRRARASGAASVKAAPAGSTGSKYTENDVRQRAKAAGKSEEEAVKAARAKGLIP
jgi:hypothetical protein